MSAVDLLALLDSDPAAGILAAADLREQRAKAATQGFWLTGDHCTAIYVEEGSSRLIAVTGIPERAMDQADAEHIAAEANPAHALAAVRRWRGVVRRHKRMQHDARACQYDASQWPCMDIRETADEAKAYLGGAS